MSDDRITNIAIVVTTKDAGVIGEEHHGDVRSADDLHRALKYMTPRIEQNLRDRGLLPAGNDADKLKAVRRLAEHTHEFDTRGRLFVYVDQLDEVLDQ